jgi:OmpA-OmpF porin, OOP family
MKSNKAWLGMVPAIAMGIFAISASVQAKDDTSGYVTNGSGDLIVKGSTGICWHNGYWTPSMAILACDPDLVPKPAPAAPPAPAPAPAAPPPPPPPKVTTEKVTMSADALFDFNKADLKSEGKAKLDDLTSKLKGINLEVIIAIGHADRFGTDKYNNALSLKRAEAVKSYLVGKGIEPNRIYTEGKGKKQPVTKPDQCKGPKSPKVVACLQPDRRVEIEVVGTRAVK